jgi:hypothetical protein
MADPATRPWGLYLSPASGEGDDLLWFDSVAELQAFVSTELWKGLLGVDPDPATADDLRGLFAETPPLSWALLEALNPLIEGAGQVHWWGHLRQLYEGQDPFAKDLRETWRSSAGAGVQDFSALKPPEQREFCDFLNSVFR